MLIRQVVGTVSESSVDFFFVRKTKKRKKQTKEKKTISRSACLFSLTAALIESLNYWMQPMASDWKFDHPLHPPPSTLSPTPPPTRKYNSMRTFSKKGGGGNHRKKISNRFTRNKSTPCYSNGGLQLKKKLNRSPWKPSITLENPVKSQ